MQCRANVSFGSSMDPFIQYQRQRQIQRTVGVDSAMYTSALGALTTWHDPLTQPQVIRLSGGAAPYFVPPGVRWNQMSDQASPSIGPRGRGEGVDVKHGSYARYLNKLKGRCVLRRGAIPAKYGRPIPYNPAYPIRGGKIVKTSIISAPRCDDSILGGDPAYRVALLDLYNQNQNQNQLNGQRVQYRGQYGTVVTALSPPGSSGIRLDATGRIIKVDTLELVRTNCKKKPCPALPPGGWRGL
jgi:hypothetical protein